MTNLPEDYLPALVAGDSDTLAAGFTGAPQIADPLLGYVNGAAALERFVHEKHAWLAERSAKLEPVRVTRTEPRTVVEALLQLQINGQPAELPIAVVGVNAGAG